jgi:hypothetical protein
MAGLALWFRCGWFLQNRRFASEDVLLPLVEQWPGDRTGAEIGHVLVASQAVYSPLDHRAIVWKDRAVTGQQILEVGIADTFQRPNEVGDIRAVMGINHADTAIGKKVVATEKQAIELQGDLARSVSGSMPDLQAKFADFDFVAVLQTDVHAAGGAFPERFPGP